MYLDKIKLEDFRNYQSQVIPFDKGINLFIGENAQGKTNIIEAIYLAAYAKSYRTLKDTDLIRFNKDFARVTLNYQKKESERVVEVFIDNTIKLVKQDGIKINKVSELIGEINIVMFSPDDLDIVKGAPSSRRKFLDSICCQLSKSYLIQLQEYSKCLKIKNNLLKKELTSQDKEYIFVLHEKMASNIIRIVSFRQDITKQLLKKAIPIHNQITDEKEALNLEYISDFLRDGQVVSQQEIREILDNYIKIEVLRKTSVKGIQKDDISIYINERDVGRYGSQGQNRTSLLTLKLANFEILKEIKEDTPVLLLDDIMSELDSTRINFMLKYIEGYQSIITTTEENFVKNNSQVKIVKISNGHLQC